MSKLKSANLKTHFRNGVPRWTVCFCGMQMGDKRITCSVCGYTITDKCHNCGKINKGQTWCQHCGANDEDE